MTEKPPRMGLARWTMGVVRAVVGVLPNPIRKRVEDRFFYAVFHTTRVTNDAYGWRPEESEPGTPRDEDPENG